MRCWHLLFGLCSFILATRADTASPRTSLSSSRSRGEQSPEPRRSDSQGSSPKPAPSSSTSAGRSSSPQRSPSRRPNPFAGPAPLPARHTRSQSTGDLMRQARTQLRAQMANPITSSRRSNPATDAHGSSPRQAQVSRPAAATATATAAAAAAAAAPPSAAAAGPSERIRARESPQRRWGRPEISGAIRGPAYVEESKHGRHGGARYIPPGQRHYIVVKSRERVSVLAQTLAEQHNGHRVRGKVNFIATSANGATHVSANTESSGHGSMTSASGAENMRESFIHGHDRLHYTSYGNSISSVSVKGDAFIQAGARGPDPRDQVHRNPFPSAPSNRPPPNWSPSSGRSSASSSPGSTPRSLRALSSHGSSSTTTTTATPSPASSRTGPGSNSSPGAGSGAGSPMDWEHTRGSMSPLTTSDSDAEMVSPRTPWARRLQRRSRR